MSSADPTNGLGSPGRLAINLPASLQHAEATIVSLLSCAGAQHNIICYPEAFTDSLNWLNQKSFDNGCCNLLVMDGHLQINDSIELIRTARVKCEFLHIVVARSSAKNLQDTNALIEAGADDVIHIQDDSPQHSSRQLSFQNSRNSGDETDQNSIDWQSVVGALATTTTATIILKSVDHRYLYVNSVFESYMGLTASQIVGSTDLDIGIPPHMVYGDRSENFRGFWKLDNEAIRQSESITVVESSIEYTGGDRRKMRTIRTPLKDKSGNVSQLLIQSEDITLQTKLEEDLNSLNHITRNMIRNNDAQVIFQDIADGLLRVTEADHCYISQPSVSGDYLETVAVSGTLSHLASVKHRKGEGFAGTAWETEETCFTSNYQEDQRRLQTVSDMRQACGVPFFVNGKVEGVLGVAYNRDWPNIETELRVIKKYAQLSALVREHHMLEKKTRWK